MHWRKTINIKGILSKYDERWEAAQGMDEEAPVIQACSAEIARALRGDIDPTLLVHLQVSVTTDEFNCALNRIYDAADEARIWLGP